MLPAAFYLGRPVLSLQTMLREISFMHHVIPRVAIDGIFGEQTLEAVMVFQREFFPPVTGQVDNDTWNRIVSLYSQALLCQSNPLLCAGYPSSTYTVEPGDSCVHLYLIQSMFRALSRVLDGLEAGEVTGVHDGPSVHNTYWIQRLNNSPETGIIDQSVWDTLSRIYTIFVTYAQTPWLTRPEVLAPEGA